MNYRTVLSAACVACVLSALGCAAAPTQESARESADDTAITTQVETAILNEPGLKRLQIDVETYKRVVRLSGFVGTRAQMDKAINFALDVDGVHTVKNDMRLKSQ